MITPNWPAPNNIKSVTICRNDKISDIFSEDVQKNISWLNQVHGGTSVELQDNKILNKPDADASYTSAKNTLCVVKTADCLPILVCNTQGTWVAAIHAGWRGLANGVIQNTLKNYKNTDRNERADLIVWFGPAISQENYIVGSDFYDKFLQLNADNYKAFMKAPDKIGGQDKWYADLQCLAKIILVSQGVALNKIFGGNYCTFSDPILFYSARREPGQKNRLISATWIESNKNL